MTLQIKIDCNNAAFEDNGVATETVAILAKVAQKIRDGETTGKWQNLMDSNGNMVGQFKMGE